jgi:hypothetical protein
MSKPTPTGKIEVLANSPSRWKLEAICLVLTQRNVTETFDRIASIGEFRIGGKGNGRYHSFEC